MKRSKQKTANQRQPGLPGPRSNDIVELLRKLEETYDSGGGSVRIYAKTGQHKPPRPAKISLEDAIQMGLGLLGELNDEFGNGLYRLDIYGSHGELVGEYEFLLEMLPRSDDEDEEEREDEDSEDEDINALLVKALMLRRDDNPELFERMIDIIIKNQSD